MQKIRMPAIIPMEINAISSESEELYNIGNTIIRIMKQETSTKTIPIKINIMPLYLLGEALKIKTIPGNITKGPKKRSNIPKIGIIRKLEINNKKPTTNNIMPKFNFDFDFPFSIAIAIHLLFENNSIIYISFDNI